ncbi:MAG: hypothetical protein JW768_07535, partial [Chitinispirillaceae bacterium]|nr:hypothetical protein [Chitinispirillaceae bacterium]
MRLSPLFVVMTAFLFPTVSGAQSHFEVISLEGTAKVQRAQKQKWDKISKGDRIYDNDMIETFFQTKLILGHGNKNVVLFGSNSKALIAIAEKSGSEKKQNELSLSLFSGGCFIKILAPERFIAFTANAVGTIDSGSMAAIVDAKSGETGVLVLGGKAVVRNIAQQKGKELAVGNTTVVLPGREPSPPLYITFRHVAVLKHFFGDKYITDEMQSSSIIPSQDRSGSGTIMLSEGAGGERQRPDVLFYKRQFDINKIYGSILDDREKHNALYRAIHRPQLLSGRHFSFGFGVGADITDGVASSRWRLTPEVRYPFFEASLRFSLMQDYRSESVIDFSSSYGLADKIQRIGLGLIRDSLCLFAGTIRDLTLGHGLVVNRFRNGDNNRIFTPLGIEAKVTIREMIKATAFLADVNEPSVGGAHITYEPSIYYFGAGYFFDLDQYRTPDRTNDIRYTRYQPRTPSGTIYPDTSITRADVSIYSLEFGTTVSENYALSASIMFDFAQKRYKGKNDGFMLRAPGLLFAWPRFSTQGGLLFESGRILSYQFNEFYMSRRSFYRYDS